MTTDDDRVAHLMGDPPASLDDAERATLDDLRDLLADPSVWVMPDPGLEDRVVAAVSAEAAQVGERPVSDLDQARERPVSDLDQAAERRVIDLEEARERRRPRRLIVALGTGAVAAMVVAGVLVSGLLSDRQGQPRFEVALAAVGPSGASGQATLTRTKSGWEIVLDARGLPRLDRGRYYQAWLRSPDGTLVPIGSFNEGGRITLWAGVSPVDYPGFTVTAEAADGNQASSGQRVLAGTVDTTP